MDKSPSIWTLAIRVRRAQLQKKQEDVAFESDIAQSHYSDIESGKRSPLSLSSKSFLKQFNKPTLSIAQTKNNNVFAQQFLQKQTESWLWR